MHVLKILAAHWLKIAVQEDWSGQDGNRARGMVRSSETASPLTAKDYAKGLREGERDGVGPRKQKPCSHTLGELQGLNFFMSLLAAWRI